MNTKLAKYEQKLSDLLDRCIFFEDTKEPVTRDKFENDFKQLVESPFMYFLDLNNREDGYAANSELVDFIEFGCGARGAFKLVELDLCKYHLGINLDFKEDKQKGKKKMRELNTINPVDALNDLNTQDKYKVLNSLYMISEAYIINDPNTLSKEFGVSFDDLTGNIVSTPSWMMGANGYEPYIILSVNGDVLDGFMNKYPLFDMKFKKYILEDILAAELEDIVKALEIHKELHGADDAGYQFLEVALSHKEALES